MEKMTTRGVVGGGRRRGHDGDRRGLAAGMPAAEEESTE
jgi:hypothetical protein